MNSSEYDQRGAIGRGLRTRRARHGGVAGDVAHGRIELGKGENEARGICHEVI